MSIEPPTSPQWRGVLRTVVEHAAESHWLTGGLVKLYRFTHPSELEGLIATWRQEVSDSVNDHTARIERLENMLRTRLRVSEEAVALGAWLAKESKNGLQHPALLISDWISAFPDMEADAAMEAVAELEHFGLIQRDRVIGGPGFARPTYDLYYTFDGTVLGYDTRKDAKELAAIILSSGSGWKSSPDLEKASGWERRRFNPALALVLTLIDQSRISREVQPDYPASGFFASEDERFQLRQFIKD